LVSGAALLLQSGADASTNMNVNEVLANRALQLLGKPLGQYETVHPLEDINLHQSTNDTYPTALRIAAIALLRRLERRVVALVDVLQAKGREVQAAGGPVASPPTPDDEEQEPARQ
jgi:aspartate ammonia-lyase